MRYMVYFKGKNDNKFTPMNVFTGQLIDRLAYAPTYGESMLQGLKDWIDHNAIVCPECKIQLRVGKKIVYGVKG